jgi:hypothetical protein
VTYSSPLNRIDTMTGKQMVLAALIAKELPLKRMDET